MTWRRRTMMAAAVLVVALGATACTRTGPDRPLSPGTGTGLPPTPSGGPFPEPTPRRLAETVMLQGTDVPGTTVDDHPRAGIDGTLAPLVNRCASGPKGPTLEFNASRDRSFQSSDGRNVYQHVIEFVPGEAARELAWYRGAVAACPLFDPGGGTRTLRIVAENVAGDDSIVVEDASPAERDLHIFVRVGDRFTEVVLSPADDSFIHVVAERAASRLRDG